MGRVIYDLQQITKARVYRYGPVWRWDCGDPYCCGVVLSGAALTWSDAFEQAFAHSKAHGLKWYSEL